MQIPSVSGLFRMRAGSSGLAVAGSPRNAGFGSTYAQALGASGQQAATAVQELTIVANPVLASSQPQLTITLPAKASSAAKTYGAVPMFIPSSALAAVTATESNGDLGAKVVAFAKQFVGTPYVAGGEDLEKGADCSGFVQSVYKHFGINLPRSSYRQSKVGQEVSVDELQPGDLLFFKTADYAPVTHVAMYIGDGKIIHASSVKTGVIISKLKIKDDFRVARRLL